MFSRLFPELSPLEREDEELASVGAAGGLCDAGESGVDAARTAAGWPLFGQYVAHDITADRSPIGAPASAGGIVNFRTPRANLESLYGAGPVGAPYLYRSDDAAALLLGENDRGELRDVPRNAQGTALIGDPRNDVHVLVSQLQVAMIRAHNRLVESCRHAGVREEHVFEAARRELVWHYQWLILNDYLPRLVGPGLIDEVMEGGPRWYRPAEAPAIPLEFAAAAFRYGHGQVREVYRLNAGSPPRRLFPDLLGFRPVPAELAVDWTMLFDVAGHIPAQRARRIDGTVVRSLIELPNAVIGGEAESRGIRSLAGRDLGRCQTYGLPSGEDVARAMGEPPLSPEENRFAGPAWRGETPLWLYFMLESAARGEGERLGPVGGRIVAEVLTGLIDCDPESYRSIDPGWEPTLPRRGVRFGLADLLAPL